MNINIDQNPPTQEEIQSHKQNLIDECIGRRKKITKLFNIYSLFLLIPTLYFTTQFGTGATADILNSVLFSIFLGLYVSCFFYNKGSIDDLIRSGIPSNYGPSIAGGQFRFFIIPVLIASLIPFFLSSFSIFCLFMSLFITDLVAIFISDLIYDSFLSYKQKVIRHYDDCSQAQINSIVEFLSINEIKEYCHKVGLQGREIVSIEYSAMENMYSIKKSEIQNKQARNLIFNNQ